MNTYNNDNAELDQLLKNVFPDLSYNQKQLDNPTNEFVSLIYQEFKNKLNSILSEALKDLEPDEAKRTESDTIYSAIRLINYTTSCVYPNVDASMTFKLLHLTNSKSFKMQVKPFLKVLYNFEMEFLKIKEILMKRVEDTKNLQLKRAELDNLKKRLASKVSEIAANENNFKDLQRNHEKIQVRFKKLTQQQDLEKQASEKLKEEVKTVLADHDNLQVLVTNIKSSIQNLNKQIVTEESYKAILSLNENVNIICAELKLEEASIQENLRGKNMDIAQLNAIDVHINALNILAKELESAHEQYTDKLSKRKHIFKTIQDLNDKMEKLNSIATQLKDKVKSHRESIKSVNLKNSETVEKLGKDLFETKEAWKQEKEIQDRQLTCKRNLEKTLLNVNKSCLAVKNEIDALNYFHKNLYQKIITLENRNTASLSNALSEIYNILKNSK